MKVAYDGPAPAYHPATGLTLVPGEFEVADDKGQELLAQKLVRVVPEADEVQDRPAEEFHEAAPAAARARRARE